MWLAAMWSAYSGAVCAVRQATQRARCVGDIIAGRGAAAPAALEYEEPIDFDAAEVPAPTASSSADAADAPASSPVPRRRRSRRWRPPPRRAPGALTSSSAWSPVQLRGVNARRSWETDCARRLRDQTQAPGINARRAGRSSAAASGSCAARTSGRDAPPSGRPC